MKLGRCAASITVIFATLTGGCAGGKVEGRVVPGGAGIVQVVGADADRPDQSGLGGATVVLRAVGRSGASGPIVGTATTAPDGRFTLRYSDRRMVRDRLQLTAKAPGYIPVQENLYLPPAGAKALVVMKQGGTASAAPADRE